MSFINVSRDGVFCFGKSFISLHNRTTLSSVHCLAKDCASHQDVEAISFVSLKSTGKSGRDSTGRNSDHAVISYRESNRFLSAVVVRCDTWSVKWTIGEFSALPSPGTVHHVIGINESSICGLVTCGDLTQIFVASELDLRSNKKDGWRSFVAVPRILNCDLGGSIVDLAEGEANKIIALTSKGTVSLLSIGISAATSGGGMEVSLSTVQFRYRFPSVSSQSHIISMGQTQPNTFALFTEGESSIHVLRMKPGSMELSSTVIDIQGSIQRVEVVGMYHLVALCQNKSVQFITVVPEEDSSTLEVLPLEPIKVPYFPVASYYNHDHQLHVIVASTEPTKSPSRVNIDEKLSAFVWCSVPLQDGPYTQSALNVATWRPLLKNEESDTLAEKPVNLLLSPEANPQDRSAGSMTLHYALTSEEMSDDAADVVVFSVRTAPYLHSRLVKQWHNAAAGLKVLLSKSCETNDPRYLSIQWNPRHLRRALRLMNQHQLCSLFLHASTVLRGSQKCRLLYSQAASAAVEVVTQIITLSRQLGVPLDPEGIEACSIFLRGARQAAHGFVSQAGRMKLMLDSCLQQRAMDSLLQGTDNKDESCPSLSAEFFGVRDIIRTQRVIPTRYSAIEWSSMCNSTVETEQIFSAAEKHLSSLHLPDGTKHRLLDWELSGRLPHSDQFVCQFEAPLVSPNQL